MEEQEVIFSILQQLDNDDLGYSTSMNTDNSTLNNSLLGYSVAIDGDTAVIGCPGEVDTDNYSYQSGSVYVFEKGSDGQWAKAQRLLPSYIIQGGEFGMSVALEGDTLLIGAGGFSGAYLGDDDSGNPIFTNSEEEDNHPEGGVVYVFTKQLDGTWMEQQQLYPSDYADLKGVPNLTTPVFGEKLDISGDNLVVSNANNSKVYVFNYDGNDWSETQKIEGEYYPYSVAIDGNNIAIGDEGVNNTGVVKMYSLSAGSWTLQQTLSPGGTQGSYGGTFGWSLLLEGDTLAILYLHDATINIYNISNNVWTKNQTISLGNYRGYNTSMSIDGRTLVVGIPSANYTADDGTEIAEVGSVQVYTQYPEENWFKIQDVLPNLDYLDNEFTTFGFSVAISGNELVVGTKGTIRNQTELDTGEGRNPIHIFKRDISPEQEPDNRPDAFTFPITNDIPLNTLVESNVVTVENFDNSIEVLISGDSTGEFRINMGAWGTTGSVSSGDTLQLRVTASDTPNRHVSVGINIGRYSTNWRAVTAVNAIPIVVMPTLETTLEVGNSVNIPLTGIFSDVESSIFSYTVDPLPTSLSVVGDAIVGTPNWNDIGETEVTITARDEHGGVTTDEFLMIIRTPTSCNCTTELAALETTHTNIGNSITTLTGLLTTLQSEFDALETKTQNFGRIRILTKYGNLYEQKEDGSWEDVHVPSLVFSNDTINYWKNSYWHWNKGWRYIPSTDPYGEL